MKIFLRVLIAALIVAGVLREAAPEKRFNRAIRTANNNHYERMRQIGGLDPVVDLGTKEEMLKGLSNEAAASAELDRFEADIESAHAIVNRPVPLVAVTNYKTAKNFCAAAVEFYSVALSIDNVVEKVTDNKWTPRDESQHAQLIRVTKNLQAAAKANDEASKARVRYNSEMGLSE